MLCLAFGPELSEIPFNWSILRARHLMKVLSVQIRGPLCSARQAKFHRNTFFSPPTFFFFKCAYFPSFVEKGTMVIGAELCSCVYMQRELITVYFLCRLQPAVLDSAVCYHSRISIHPFSSTYPRLGHIYKTWWESHMCAHNYHFQCIIHHARMIDLKHETKNKKIYMFKLRLLTGWILQVCKMNDITAVTYGNKQRPQEWMECISHL